MISLRSMLSSCVCLLLVHAAAFADPEPVLTAASQPKLMRGQATTITITGNHLAQTSRIILDGLPGIAAELVPSDKPNPKSITLKLTVDATATLGERELRLVTPGGVSNKLDLEVTFLPVAVEKEPNNSISTPQTVTLPAMLLGTINGGADVDAFRFAAKKGERLIFESFAQRAKSPLDTTLKLYDPAGREVARSEDAFGTDSLIAYEVAADGDHTLIIHDVQYRGGGDYTYRINAGAIPYAQAIFPLGGKRGTSFDAQLIGWNLPAATRRIDLTDKPVGVTTLFATPDGASNPLTIEVSESDEYLEAEPNSTIAAAGAIPSLPIIINGIIAQDGDQDIFRFKVDKPMKLRFGVEALRLGSKLDALLALHDAKGSIIVRSGEAAPGSDVALVRDVSPGEYYISITDLTSLGGADYGYRLSIAPPKPVEPDFSVRFFPDTIRLHRGGRTLVQCEVTRTGGFAGEVTVALKNAPPGVTAVPLTIANAPVSGIFVIQAAADADLRVTSLELIATGKQGEKTITRTAQPLATIEPVMAAYLSVQPPSPFVIDVPKPLTEEEVAQIVAQIEAIEKQMLAPHAEADKAMIDWEKATLATAQGDIAMSPWQVIGPFPAASADEAFGKAFEPEKTVDLKTPIGNLKWEAKPQWTDGELWNELTGENAANYLYRTIEVAADRSLELSLGSDDGIKVFLSGKEVLGNNIGRAAAPDQEKVTLALKAGSNALLLKIVNGAGPSGFYFKASAQSHGIPAAIATAIKLPADKRNDQQKNELLAYYRAQSPLFAPQRVQVASLRERIGVREEIARLHAKLNADMPELAVAQAAWEKNATADTWSTLEFSEMKSVGGARFTKQKDGSILLAAANPPKDTYTLTTTINPKAITAIRLEALADAKLKGGGPGRAENGNFVLTQFNITAAPASDPAKQQKVELHSAKATFEQEGFPIASTLDGNDGTGWAISPKFGENHTAIYMVNPIAGIEGDAILTITMRNESPHVQHTLGNFRISTTTAAKPEITQPSLSGPIVKLIAIPADKRNAKQKTELAAYYRSIAPLLAADRQRLLALEATENIGNPSMKYNQTSTVAFEVKRATGFTGDITITALGYSDGRDPKGTPLGIAKDILVTPIVIKGDQTIGTITLKAKDKSEMGTRTIVLQAQTTINGETVTQITETIPVSITK